MGFHRGRLFYERKKSQNQKQGTAPCSYPCLNCRSEQSLNFEGRPKQINFLTLNNLQKMLKGFNKISFHSNNFFTLLRQGVDIRLKL